MSVLLSPVETPVAADFGLVIHPVVGTRTDTGKAKLADAVEGKDVFFVVLK
jgi:hypothetical protein